MPAKGGGRKSGRIDEKIAGERDRVGAADVDLDAGIARAAADNGAVEHAHRAGVLRVTLQRDHEAVAVDNAGGG